MKIVYNLTLMICLSMFSQLSSCSNKFGHFLNDQPITDASRRDNCLSDYQKPRGLEDTIINTISPQFDHFSSDQPMTDASRKDNCLSGHQKPRGLADIILNDISPQEHNQSVNFTTTRQHEDKVSAPHSPVPKREKFKPPVCGTPIANLWTTFEVTLTGSNQSHMNLPYTLNLGEQNVTGDILDEHRLTYVTDRGQPPVPPTTITYLSPLHCDCVTSIPAQTEPLNLCVKENPLRPTELSSSQQEAQIHDSNDESGPSAHTNIQNINGTIEQHVSIGMDAFQHILRQTAQKFPEFPTSLFSNRFPLNRKRSINKTSVVIEKSDIDQDVNKFLRCVQKIREDYEAQFKTIIAGIPTLLDDSQKDDAETVFFFTILEASHLYNRITANYLLDCAPGAEIEKSGSFCDNLQCPVHLVIVKLYSNNIRSKSGNCMIFRYIVKTSIGCFVQRYILHYVFETLKIKSVNGALSFELADARRYKIPLEVFRMIYAIIQMGLQMKDKEQSFIGVNSMITNHHSLLEKIAQKITDLKKTKKGM